MSERETPGEVFVQFRKSERSPRHGEGMPHSLTRRETEIFARFGQEGESFQDTLNRLFDQAEHSSTILSGQIDIPKPTLGHMAKRWGIEHRTHKGYMESVMKDERTGSLMREKAHTDGVKEQRIQTRQQRTINRVQEEQGRQLADIMTDHMQKKVSIRDGSFLLGVDRGTYAKWRKKFTT